MLEHEAYIKQSYRLARSAQENGNQPFGALLVINGDVILTAENTVVTDHDITRHAEMNLVSRATRELDPENLTQSTLYTSNNHGSIFSYCGLCG